MALQGRMRVMKMGGARRRLESKGRGLDTGFRRYDGVRRGGAIFMATTEVGCGNDSMGEVCILTKSEQLPVPPS